MAKKGIEAIVATQEAELSPLARQIDHAFEKDGLPSLLDLNAAAKALGLHPQTVWRMIQAELKDPVSPKHLKPFSAPTKRKRWYVLRTNVAKFLAQGGEQSAA